MERHRFAPHKAPLASMSRLSTPNTSCECVCTIEQRALTVIVFAVPRRVGVGRRERLKPSLPRFHLGDSGPVIVRLRRRRRIGGRRHRSEQRALRNKEDAKTPRRFFSGPRELFTISLSIIIMHFNANKSSLITSFSLGSFASWPFRRCSRFRLRTRLGVGGHAVDSARASCTRSA